MLRENVSDEQEHKKENPSLAPSITSTARSGTQLFTELVTGIALYVAALALLVRFHGHFHDDETIELERRRHWLWGDHFEWLFREGLRRGRDDLNRRRPLPPRAPGTAMELQQRPETKLIRVPPRQPEEGDLCPVCFDPLSAKKDINSIEYCRWGCGKAVHGDCMMPWLEAKKIENAVPTCVYCKIPWFPMT
jgi:hypothetical protein